MYDKHIQNASNASSHKNYFMVEIKNFILSLGEYENQLARTEAQKNVTQLFLNYPRIYS